MFVNLSDGLDALGMKGVFICGNSYMYVARLRIGNCIMALTHFSTIS